MNGSRGLLAWGNSHWLATLLAALLLVAGIIGAWRITAGDDELLHVAQFLDFLVSFWMLATYAVVVALILASVAFVRFGDKVAGRSGDIGLTLRRQAQFWIAAYLVFAVLTIAIGCLFGLELHESMMRDRFEQQRAIARLKAQQVDKWAAERLLDAELLASTLSGLAFDRLHGDSIEARQLLLGLTEFLAGYPERVAVSLYGPDGTVLAHLGRGAVPDREMTAAVESLAATGRASMLVDAYRTADSPPQVHLGVIVAVGARGRASPRAYVATTLDPFRVLFREVMAWPGPSPSSEVMVVRRDGDDILFLTPLRLSPAQSGPMQSREKISDSGLSATRVLVDGDGVHLGADYRGVEVMTASHRVESLPWIVVAKTDHGELMVPVRAKQRRVAAAVGVTLLITAAMILFMARGQRAGTLAYFRRIETERRSATLRYAHLVRYARDVVLTLDPEGRIVEANEAAMRAYGYTMEEMKGLTVKDLRTPAEYARHARQWVGGQAPDGVLFETVHRRKDGSTFPVEVSGRTLEVEGQSLRQAFIRDITVRRELQHDVARLVRVQRAMQAGARILLRADSELDLFQGMCDAIVDVGGYPLAAVGVANHDEHKTISFPASAGRSDGYLEEANGTWGPGPNGRGTTGTAIRLGSVQVNKDFATNPEVAVWRDAALAHGLRSSVSLPLRAAGDIFGALVIHAAEPDAFNAQELELLEILADQISYGLDVLHERQRNRALRREIDGAANLQSMMRAMVGILARARSEVELYREICTAMVEVGGFRLAAVAGRRDDARRTVECLAVYGTDEGYLAGVTATPDDGSGANEPLAAALRSGDICTIADIDSAQAIGTWRGEAVHRGLRSAIALPLKQSGRTFAVLALYAGLPGAFEEQTIEKMAALVRDLSIRAATLRLVTA